MELATGGSSRRAKRRRRALVVGIAAAAACAAGIAALLFGGSDAGRAGTLTGDTVVATTAAPTGDPLVTGGGAQGLLNMLGIQMPTTLSGGNFAVAAGFTIDAVSIEQQSDGSFKGSATVSVGGSGLHLRMNVLFTSKNDWTFTVASGTASTFSPVAGISIDTSTIQGSISMVAGSTNWAIAGSTITWNVAPGATLVTQFSLSNTCPLSPATKCPSANSKSAYLGMPAASLKVDGFANTITLAGGVDLSGGWARLEGSVGNIAFEGNGITNTQLVVWRGERNDSYDSSMVMPDLSSLNGGTNLEFCGTFTISIPKITNKSTGGCARWSKQGIVLAQAGGGTTVVTSVPSTDASGSSSSLAAGAQVKGLAWTNLANAASFNISFGGVQTALANRTWSLAGTGNLPGAAASALGVNLGSAAQLLFDLRGTFSATEISLSGQVPVSLHIGSAPFVLDVKSLTASLSADTSGKFSFSIGTQTDVTLGYAPQTRAITSSLTLAAATKPSVGMSLSLSAVGNTNAADAGVTGLSSSSRLTRPDLATFIWPDQFGIKGMNLFGLSASIGWAGGSPVVSFTSTTYLNPAGADMARVLQCNGACDASDWMISTLAVSASYTNPCFAYGFDGSAGGSTLAIDGGVMRTSVFKVGFAPSGCSIQAGGSTFSLPPGFAGFAFTTTFGNTTLNVATQVSIEGFEFSAALTNFQLGGISYPSITLFVKIDDAGSEITFTGQMQSALGDADVSSSFVANSSGMSQSLSASVTNWSMGRADTMEIPEFNFTTSISLPSSGGCADFSASASGSMKVKSKTYTIKDASFRLTCNGLQSLTLAINMEHTSSGGAVLTTEFRLNYSKTSSQTSLAGGASFGYQKYGSWSLYGSTFSRHISINIYANFSLVVGSESSAAFSFGGGFNADRVSGSLDCLWTSTSSDFRCSGSLRLNPSWAGIYHKTWGDL